MNLLEAAAVATPLALVFGSRCLCRRGSDSSGSSGDSSSSGSSGSSSTGSLSPLVLCSGAEVHLFYELVVPIDSNVTDPCHALSQGVFVLGSNPAWSNADGTQCGANACAYFSIDAAKGPTGEHSSTGRPTYDRLYIANDGTPSCSYASEPRCFGIGSQTNDVWQMLLNPGGISSLRGPGTYHAANTPTGAIDMLTFVKAGPFSVPPGFPDELTVIAAPSPD